MEYLEFELSLRARFMADMEGTTHLGHSARLAKARARVNRNDPRYYHALRNAVHGTPWAF